MREDYTSAGVLFKKWNPETKHTYKQFMDDFSAFMTSNHYSTECHDRTMHEHVKRIEFTCKFRCRPEDFTLCNENAEYQILRMITQPFLDKVNEARNAIFNSDRQYAMTILSELDEMLRKGERGVA